MGTSWALVDGKVAVEGAAIGPCGVVEPSMYCRMSLPIDRPTDGENTSVH